MLLLNLYLAICVAVTWLTCAVAGTSTSTSSADLLSNRSTPEGNSKIQVLEFVKHSIADGNSYGRDAQSYQGIVKRSKIQKSWNDCLDTGKKILELIACQQPKTNKFNDVHVFEDGGYEFDEPIPEADEWDDDISRALKHLNLDESGWLAWYLHHHGLKNANGNDLQIYLYTHSASGSIVSTKSYTAMNPQPDGKRVDVVYRMSDIAFICLQEHARMDKIPLKFARFIILNVSNQATMDRYLDIAKLLSQKERDTSMTESPGISFGINQPLADNAGHPGHGTFSRVMLGSPTGLRAGWLLVGRQHEFPGRTIESVAVFGAEYDDDDKPEEMTSFDVDITIGDLPGSQHSQPPPPHKRLLPPNRKPPAARKLRKWRRKGSSTIEAAA